MSHLRIKCTSCEFSFQVDRKHVGQSMDCPNPNCDAAVILAESPDTVDDATPSESPTLQTNHPTVISRLKSRRTIPSWLRVFVLLSAIVGTPLIAVVAFVSSHPEFSLDSTRLFAVFTNGESRQPQPAIALSHPAEGTPSDSVSPAPMNAEPQPDGPSFFEENQRKATVTVRAKIIEDAESWPVVPTTVASSAPGIPPITWVNGDSEWQPHKDGRGYTVRAGLNITSRRSNGLVQIWTSNGLAPPALILTYRDNTGTTGQIEYGTIGARVQYRNVSKRWYGFGLVPYENPTASTYRRYAL